jgi:two-component system chemotaxis sensor kinase CheA
VVESAGEGPAEAPQARQVLLVFRARGRRMALPLGRVARLEEVPRGAVERAADCEVIQYRGALLPLVRLAGEPEDGPLQVVVCRDGAEGRPRQVGLVVERILDVVEEVLDVKQVVPCPGILGSAVIQQRVTDLYDLESAFPAAGAWPGGLA